MKMYVFFALFSFAILSAQAQQASVSVSEGDVFTIQDPEGPEFQHLHFPNKNIIIKRGAVPDMKKVYGTKVVVTSVEMGSGATRVWLERQDGRKFFRHYRSVEASLDKALESGELTR